MDVRQLEAKLIELQRRLDDKKDSRRKAKQELNKWEDAVEVVQKKIKELEDKIQEGLSVIRAKLANLMDGCKFKETYLNGITGRLNGEKGTKVMNMLRDMQQKAKKECLSLDDKIDRYDKEIRALEDEITAVRQQMNVSGGEV